KTLRLTVFALEKEKCIFFRALNRVERELRPVLLANLGSNEPEDIAGEVLVQLDLGVIVVGLVLRSSRARPKPATLLGLTQWRLVRHRLPILLLARLHLRLPPNLFPKTGT